MLPNAWCRSDQYHTRFEVSYERLFQEIHTGGHSPLTFSVKQHIDTEKQSPTTMVTAVVMVVLSTKGGSIIEIVHSLVCSSIFHRSISE